MNYYMMNAFVLFEREAFIHILTEYSNRKAYKKSLLEYFVILVAKILRIDFLQKCLFFSVGFSIE